MRAGHEVAVGADPLVRDLRIRQAPFIMEDVWRNRHAQNAHGIRFALEAKRRAVQLARQSGRQIAQLLADWCRGFCDVLHLHHRIERLVGNKPGHGLKRLLDDCSANLGYDVARKRGKHILDGVGNLIGDLDLYCVDDIIHQILDAGIVVFPKSACERLEGAADQSAEFSGRCVARRLSEVAYAACRHEKHCGDIAPVGERTRIRIYLAKRGTQTIGHGPVQRPGVRRGIVGERHPLDSANHRDPPNLPCGMVRHYAGIPVAGDLHECAAHEQDYRHYDRELGEDRSARRGKTACGLGPASTIVPRQPAKHQKS